MRDKWFPATRFLRCLWQNNQFLFFFFFGMSYTYWHMAFLTRGAHIHRAVKGETKLQAGAVVCTVYQILQMLPLANSMLTWSEPGGLEGLCRYPGKPQGAAATVTIKTAPTGVMFARKKRSLAGSSNNFSWPVLICCFKSVWLQARERHWKRDWLHGESPRPALCLAHPSDENTNPQ